MVINSYTHLVKKVHTECIVSKFNYCLFIHLNGCTRMFTVYIPINKAVCDIYYKDYIVWTVISVQISVDMSCFKSLPTVLVLLVVLLQLCRYSTPTVNHHGCSPSPPSAITVPNVESGVYNKWRPSNSKQVHIPLQQQLHTPCMYYSPSTTDWKTWHRLMGNVQCLTG